MSTSSPALSMRIHPIRNVVRLEGYQGDLTHSRYGRGAHFQVDIPGHLISEDLSGFVAAEFGDLDFSDIHGRLIWDSGDISELTWMRLTQSPGSAVSVHLQSCDPWPPTGSQEEFHDPFDVAPDVAELVVAAVDHWDVKPGPLDGIGMRVMARLTATDPQASRDELQFMAVLARNRWVEQDLPDTFTLAKRPWEEDL